MSDTHTPAPVPCYLVEHPKSGHALFRLPTDAREWAEQQTGFHHPGQQTRWVSGGEHGWEAQRLPNGQTAATVYALVLDGTLEDSRFASYWED